MEEREEISALFRGEPIETPTDLFIPPDALEIWLESYEGPLDLLLHLIRKNNYDILDIPIAAVADQYMQYLDYIESQRFELASEYLVMASWLAEIKSRLLLPKAPPIEGEEEEDPRSELMEKLALYERYKKVAEYLRELPIYHPENSKISAQLPQFNSEAPLPKVEVEDLTRALQALLKRAKLVKKHTIHEEKISVDERMQDILSLLKRNRTSTFESCFDLTEGRYGISISFMAILELTRLNKIKIEQKNAYDSIELSLP